MNHMIISPRPLAIVCHGEDLLCYLTIKEIEKKYGKYYLQKNNIKPFYCLSFTDGVQAEPVKPIGDELRMSGRALMELMLFHALKNEHSFTTNNFKRFFEGKALEAVHSYFFDVVVPIMKATAPDTIQGADIRWSVAQELSRNGEFWRAIGAPLTNIIETRK